jgi:hypothetical protein
MADSRLNLDRIISIVAITLALGSAAYSGLKQQNTLEFLTKQDFNTFQIENVKKMTGLEGTVQNGFNGVSQQLASLNFVNTKEFQDFKEKAVASSFELQKQIDFLKKDLETMQKTATTNVMEIAAIKTKIALLEAQKG